MFDPISDVANSMIGGAHIYSCIHVHRTITTIDFKRNHVPNAENEYMNSAPNCQAAMPLDPIFDLL